MEPIDSQDYWAEVESIARGALEEHRRGRDAHTYIHETIDSHQWVIYHYYAPMVLEHTDSEDACEDMGDMGGILSERGWRGLLAYIACCAMLRDCEKRLSDLRDEEADEEDSE